ncbi:GNAT family N-acetyltransferase [Cryobacterium sp. SO2]|uniref:GNAT family N-acetyltransferase n=1 Tax=Cryobacterium sp. SO2 TaxID=1897060 RepID=UPI00223D8DE7|nr:GNAT family N-acetyltransferase [Cryobacterium sp. SO2]WEO78364.1 GNAT family N-acetyltransferase [Cryobacterium sp. SO2]
MTDESTTGPAPVVRLVLLDTVVLRALLQHDRAAAGARTGLVFPGFFDSQDWLWRLHIDRMHDQPESTGWLARAVVDQATGEVVGHAGFHFQPDADGMVEIGYTILPDRRGRGLAQATVTELLAFAAADPRVRTVRASVSPDNAASLAVIAHHGFRHTGEQWDDEDGLELLFERTPR